jgi:hypothetical protein
MILRKLETGVLKRKNWIALCGDLALEEAVNPS